MDLFLAISQGVGLALACGIIIAAFAAWPLRGRGPTPAFATAAVVAGALVFAKSLADEDYASAPGLIAGAVCALLGWAAVASFLAGARARLETRQGSPAFLALFTAGAAVVLAGMAIVLAPLCYLALAFCAWVLIVQRRRAGQKYEGLRVLR